jgi:ATP-dependent RNA helicase DOB1
MSTPDLFSFLNGAPSGDEDKDVDISEPRHVDKNAKRRAITDPMDDRANGAVSDIHAPKKARVLSPAPVVVDEFETEAKREMAASGGLTGSVEAGSRLELRHQVSITPSHSLH